MPLPEYKNQEKLLKELREQKICGVFLVVFEVQIGCLIVMNKESEIQIEAQERVGAN